MNRSERESLILSPEAYRCCPECLGCKTCCGFDEILDLGYQAVVDFVDSPKDLVLESPLRLIQCRHCSLVQLNCHVNPDLLYRDFWYKSGINESMRKELASIVESAQELVSIRAGDAVLDIGCNDGTLLSNYGKVASTYGVDPASVALEAAKEHVILNDYFNESSVYKLNTLNDKRGFKHVFAIAMFYDLADPSVFLKNCKEVLAQDGVLIIQMNYLLSMIENTAFDNISHEHLAYYSLMSLEPIVREAGLKIQKVSTNDVNGGSFRAYIRHEDFVCDESPSVPAMLSLEAEKLSKEAFAGFRNRVENCKTWINNFLEEVSSVGAVFAYGASTRGSTLLQTLGCSKYLMGAAERDARKFGKMTAGSWLRIFPEQVCRDAATYFFCLPYHFKESIIEREKEWLADGGTFIFPLPEPKRIFFDEESKVREVSL